MYCFMLGLIVSGCLRLISVVKLSEEAGIQCLGDDSSAITRVRILSVTVAGKDAQLSLGPISLRDLISFSIQLTITQEGLEPLSLRLPVHFTSD